MKAAIVNPYLDTLGGGERYTMSFAKVLADAGYQVDVQWKSEAIREKLEKRFGIKLSNISFKKDVLRGDGYDACFWVSDGSIPTLHARKNFLHFQIPFIDVNGKTLLNRMKLFRVNKIICNSFFTKTSIDSEYGVNSIVIYPPVDVATIKPKRKENVILSVGRFSQLTQAKHQDILVEVFKKFVKAGHTDWKLILAGGTEIGSEDMVKKLKKNTNKWPIEIIESPDYTKIVDLYGHAKLFWTAAGYGVDEEKFPKNVEHFGIALVEAMAAGCIPFAYNAGGHKEIIVSGKNGFLWRKKSEFLDDVNKIISDKKQLLGISEAAKIASRVYEYDRFENEVLDLL